MRPDVDNPWVARHEVTMNQKRSRIIVLLGAPGAGKGIQAQLLHQHLGLPQISTGDLLRRMALEASELGRRVAVMQAAGDLVGDELIAEVVGARTRQVDCRDGYILDGYPRTLAQGLHLERLALQQGHRILPIYVEIPTAELLSRLTDRRTCPVCNEIYNLQTRPPSRADFCDHHDTDVVLVHRSDDNVESVAHRLDVWDRDTKPLYDFYRSAGRLISVDGAKSIEGVFSEIESALGGLS
jgi:adenylate kinase